LLVAVVDVDGVVAVGVDSGGGFATGGDGVVWV
jgi:hypothetical protein